MCSAKENGSVGEMKMRIKFKYKTIDEIPLEERNTSILRTSGDIGRFDDSIHFAMLKDITDGRRRPLFRVKFMVLTGCCQCWKQRITQQKISI